MSPSTTVNSSASVIPFNAQPAPKTAKLSFAQTRDAWLIPLLADSRFTDGEVRVCVAVYLGFNREHYEKTDQLLSWPGWLKLEGETTKGEKTIERTFKKLERLGKLQILRGGFDPKTGWRRPNKYLAKLNHPSLETGGPPVTSVQIHPSEPPVSRVGRLFDRLGEYDSKKEKQIFGNSRGPAAPEERRKPFSDSLTEQQRRWIAEGKSPFTGIPKKSPLNGRRPT